MKRLYTIGQISELTGINKRTPKYYIERDILTKKIIGQTVKVIVDRPLGSYHPQHKDIYYPINYGYVEGILAPDGEEQDAYILGVDVAIKEFTGNIIAVIHRNDDIEEKWLVAPEGVLYTKEEILESVKFQEQYFQSEIQM